MLGAAEPTGRAFDDDADSVFSHGDQSVAAAIAARRISGMRSSASAGVIKGGARQIVSPIGGSALPGRMRGKQPARQRLASDAPAEPERRRLGIAVGHELDAAHHAEPAHIADNRRSRSSSRPASRRRPMTAARSTNPSLSMISTLRNPTAQHTGWPE